MTAVGLAVGSGVYVAKRFRDVGPARVQSDLTGGPTTTPALLPPQAAKADAELIQARTKAEAAAPGELKNSIGMVLVPIPAGTFRMGAPDGEDSAQQDERPQWKVEISKAFYLGKYEVTQEQYQKVMKTNPSYFSATGGGKNQVAGMDTANFPVENVSWEDAVEFCGRLSELPAEKQAGRRYELPTEAEWEYACRGGTSTPFHFGPRLNGIEANCDGRHPYGTGQKGPSLWRTAAVGSYTAKAPHPWGLCDMHGNVWEWCQDWYDKSYYSFQYTKDPQGPNKGVGRVVRGGSWINAAWYCRAALRDRSAPAKRINAVGFRVRLRRD
jgi:formylglycine-generating enzyme required for sulfatase activity